MNDVDFEDRAHGGGTLPPRRARRGRSSALLAAAAATLALGGAACRNRDAGSKPPHVEAAGAPDGAGANGPAAGVEAGPGAEAAAPGPLVIRGATLRLLDGSTGVQASRLVFLDDDRWAASLGGRVVVVQGTEVRQEIPVAGLSSGHDLVRGADGRSLFAGAARVELDGEPRVDDIPFGNDSPPCGGRVREEAVASADGRRVAVIEREAPSGCLEPDGSYPPARPLAEELVLLDRATGAVVARRDGSWPAPLAMSASYVAAGGYEGIAIFSGIDLSPVATVPAPAGAASALAFSPDGAALATVRSDGTVVVIDTSRWAAAVRIEAGAAGRALAFHPRLPLLATAGMDGTVRLWNLAGPVAAPLAELRLESRMPGAPGGLAFSPDGSRLLVARDGLDDTALVAVQVDATGTRPERPYDALAALVRLDAAGRPLPPGAVARLGTSGVGEAAGILDVAFTADGLLAVDVRARAAIWPERSPRWSGGEGEPIEYEHVALAPDGTVLARAPRDATWFEIVDRASGEVRRRVELGQRIMVLRAGPGSFGVGVWRQAGLFGDDGEPRRLHEHRTTVTAVAVSVDGSRFASSDIDGVTYVSETPGDGAPVRIKEAVYARDACFTPAGDELVLAHPQSQVVFRDARTGAVRRTVDTGLEPIDRVAISTDGRRLATSGHETVVTDLADGTVTGFAGPLSADVLAFDPATGRLATASRYGGLQLWDPVSGRALPTAAGHTASVVAVRFEDDGGSVASVDRDGNAIRWTIAASEPEFLGVGGEAAAAARPAAGGTSATATTYGAELRDGATGERLGAVETDGARVVSLDLSPDGRRLALGLDDRTILIFDLPPAPP
ncbi:MAG: hypothetical protein HY905_14945 [Deltaproteobacteria bacterium]|nr:hypothetical protein [Deltaproteobacteria bacterium]